MKARRCSVVSFCLFFSMLSTANADQPSFTLQGGDSVIGTHFASRDRTPTVFADVFWREHYIGNSQFSWAPDITGGWIDGRDTRAVDHYTTRDHIWLLGAGVRLHYGDDAAWYHPFFLSFQPSAHTGRTPALSSSYEFTYTIGWQAKHWMVGIRHISNAYLHEPNRGESMLLVGVTF
jgi:Lipid A 3-O-deacylase (PagL)